MKHFGLALLVVLFAGRAAAAPAPAASLGPAATKSDASGTAVKPAAVTSKVPADLAAKAKVSLEAARATALAKVPKGRLKSEELEEEHGKLQYSFDIKVPGKSGIEEVEVDAMDGSVIKVTHESAAAEKAEAAKDAKDAKAAAKAKNKKPPQG